jgi:hypothetical protein
MSAIIEQPTQLTPQQRINQAASSAARTMGVGNTKAIAAALIEAATELAANDSNFASRIRALYQEITATKGHTPKNPPISANKSHYKLEDDGLVPIKHMQVHLDLSAPLDPFFLLELYGAGQLPKALSRYQLKRLLEAMAAVQEKFPGTKPRNKSKKDDVIAYIVEMLTAR